MPAADGEEDLDRRARWLDLVKTPLLLLARERLDIVAANPDALELLGEQRFPQLPRSVEAALGTYAARRLGEAFADLKPGAASHAVTIECLVAAGRHRLVFAMERWPDAVAQPELWLVTLHDADPRPSGEWRKDLVQILDLLPVGVEIYDADMSALFYNTFSDELFSYKEKAILAYDDWWDLGLPDPAERARVVAEWEVRLAAARARPDSTQSLEFWAHCRDGTRRKLEFRLRFVGGKLILLILDVTKQRALEEDLRRLADSDPLTELANRRFFFAAAERAFARRGPADGGLALLMLDLDHFKAINDRHGHPAGDAVLQAVAGRIRGALRPGDLAARLGGEEFAVLLEDLPADEVTALAERLRHAVSAAPVPTPLADIAVQVSIGAAARRPADATLEDLLGRVDRALYAAKAAGRNRIVLAEG